MGLPDHASGETAIAGLQSSLFMHITEHSAFACSLPQLYFHAYKIGDLLAHRPVEPITLCDWRSILAERTKRNRYVGADVALGIGAGRHCNG
jgi:hypothetical protein